MRKLVPIAILTMVGVFACAEEYFLEIEKVCSSEGNQLTFECKVVKSERHLIFSESGFWYRRNSTTARNLKVVLNDAHILVLENPVLFSGTDTIHIIKRTGKFYWSQFAYSDILLQSEATVKYGSVVKVAK
jgi:hypothetical protein